MPLTLTLTISPRKGVNYDEIGERWHKDQQTSAVFARRDQRHAGPDSAQA
jgi:hypothetical protein